MSTFVSDTLNVMNRELKPVWREPMAVVFAMIQPLVFLGLFAPLLPEMATGGSALQWFVPGIVAMTALMGASFTGSNLMEEMQSGSHERQLVSPLGPPGAAGRPRPQGGRADADAGRDHRRGRDAVQLRPAPRRGAGRGPGPVALQHRRRRAVVRPRAGVEGPGLDVLDGPADAALPGAAHRRRAAADGRRAPLARDRLDAQPDDVRRRRDARALRRHLPGRRRRAGRAGAAVVAALGLVVGVRAMRRSS